VRESEYQERDLLSHDGTRLFFRKWSVAKAKGTVGIVHGFAEHSGRYDHIGIALNQTGWAATAFDYRGHGKASGKRAFVSRFDQYLEDVSCFIEETRLVCPEGPLVLLGHSLGGLICVRYVQTQKLDAVGLILSSPFLGMAMRVPTFKAIAGRLLSFVWPTISMKSGLDPATLSHDANAVESYRRDPMVFDYARARWFSEVLLAQDLAMRDARRCLIPTLMLLAGDDQIASTEVSQHFFENMAVDEKEKIVYEGFYHEVLNEEKKGKVIEDLCMWLEKNLVHW
jgi:alpha-beta hydrolase superfamily lysophospholipase